MSGRIINNETREDQEVFFCCCCCCCCCCCGCCCRRRRRRRRRGVRSVVTGVEGVERRAGGGRGRLAQRGDLGEARVDGDAVVVERRRLQDDGRRAQTHGRRED